MFKYIGNTLYAEEIPLSCIAEEFGTPLYVYSRAAILERIARLKSALGSIAKLTVCYAVKVNGNLSLLKIMAEEGLGADIISIGELERYLEAGGTPDKVVFAGVAKTREEIAHAIKRGIFMFNAESLAELSRINQIAGDSGKVVNVAVRINPDVEAGTLSKITTGKAGGKFGIAVKTLLGSIAVVRSLKNINLMGVDAHIGSQILSAEPYIKAYTVVAEVIEKLRKSGFDISCADVGGGFGIPYRKEEGGFDFERYEKEAAPILKSMDAHIIVEPGRFIVGESGALLMNIEYIKHEWGKKFIIVNGGMNDYIRTAMYDAYNDILPCTRRKGNDVYDIAGPVCESSDFFAKNRKLSKVLEGDNIALMDAGAYGCSMASAYNARPITAEVLVDKGKTQLIRRRQTAEELSVYEREYL